MNGLRAATGVPKMHVTPLSMHRTFVKIVTQGDMDIVHLQAMLGHSSLEMVRHYAQRMDEDLVREHKAHSPINNILRTLKGERTGRLRKLFSASDIFGQGFHVFRL